MKHLSIKFKDESVKEYLYDELMHCPLFKRMIERMIKSDSEAASLNATSGGDALASLNNGFVFSIDRFNSDIIDHLIYRTNINFDKYDFDELFNAAEFLKLHEIESVKKQFMKHLKHLLEKDINKVNLNNLRNYITSDYEYILSCVLNKCPKLFQLYPFVTQLIYNNNLIELDKFTNLVKLEIHFKGPETFKKFDNLKNLKVLVCSYNCALKDGCFDIFENLEELTCECCENLKKPFNENLKNLKSLRCGGCYNLEDGCFNIFENLEVFCCYGCKKIKNMSTINYKSWKLTTFEHDVLKNKKVMLSTQWDGFDDTRYNNVIYSTGYDLLATTCRDRYYCPLDLLKYYQVAGKPSIKNFGMTVYDMRILNINNNNEIIDVNNGCITRKMLKYIIKNKSYGEYQIYPRSWIEGTPYPSEPDMEILRNPLRSH